MLYTFIIYLPFLKDVSLSTVSPLLAKNILYYSYWFKWAFMDVTFNFLEENILPEPDIDKLMQKRK